MAPKKKGEEEEVPPEQYLPAGYSLGCALFWGGERTPIDFLCEGEKNPDDADRILKCGIHGVLAAVTTVTEEKTIEVVEVSFNGDTERTYTLPLKLLYLQPLDLGLWDELETGLKLPLRGVDIDSIWALGDDLELQATKLEEFLKWAEARIGSDRQTLPAARLEIVQDFYLYNLAQAKALCLSGLQAAVFLAAMGSALNHFMQPSDSFRKSLTNSKESRDSYREDSFNKFQEIILQHTMNDPPRCLQILRGSDVRLLSEFATESLFKHFTLYQYCLNFDREVHVLRVGVDLDGPSAPPDLNGARNQNRRKAQEVLPPPQEAPNGYPDPVADSGEMGADSGQADGGEGGEDGVDDSIERLVSEKLRQTEAKLQKKLDAREEAFKKKLDASKGKK